MTSRLTAQFVTDFHTMFLCGPFTEQMHDNMESTKKVNDAINTSVIQLLVSLGFLALYIDIL